MSPDAQIRPAEHRDVQNIARLVRSSFPQHLQPYMIQAQHGIDRYLGIVLTHPTLEAARLLYVAHSLGDNELDGYADFSLTAGNSAFLSYVCVAPKAQGQGLAKRMILHFLKNNPTIETLALDVFINNNPALHVYNALGFMEEHRSKWLTAPTGKQDNCSPTQLNLSISNFPAAHIAHHEFGFSDMSGKWKGRDIRIGRLGDKKIRFFQVDNLFDQGLLQQLSRLFPSVDEVFCIAPENSDPGQRLGAPGSYSTVATAQRMTLHRPARVVGNKTR